MKHFASIMSCFFLVLVTIPYSFAAGPAFSGITANADKADTVVANPAGMMRLKQPSWYVNSWVLYMDNKTDISADGTGQKQSTSDDSFVTVPGVYYAQPVGERWAVGIGPNAVMGLGASYDDDWAGRYLLKDWSLTFAGIAPSAAYRVNDQFSVGASLPIMYSRYTLEKAVYNLAPDQEDGSFELKADGWGLGINVGMLYEPTAYTRFGLVYRSKVSMTVEGNPNYSGLTEQRSQLLNQFGALNHDISFDTGTPQILVGGIFHDFQNSWSCSLDVAWIDFSDWGFEDVEIGDSDVSTAPGNYKDIWAGTLGVNYELTPKLTVQSGVFYVSSPMDEEDHTAFMRLDQMWGAGIGLEYKYRMERSVSFNVTYMHFGDGKFTAQDVPIAGNIEGEYTKNYALAFGLGLKW
jgi:long-chain fatty acid transport protein